MSPTPDPQLVCPACGGAIPAGARFCPSCGHPVERVPAAAAAAARAGEAAGASRASAHPAAEDELRPITALFADIVGSTSLGERLGPDEVKALIGECVSRMSRAVEEFGGTVQA